MLLEVRVVPRVRAGVGRARRFGRGGLNATPNTPTMDGAVEAVRVLLAMALTKTVTLTRPLDGVGIALISMMTLPTILEVVFVMIYIVTGPLQAASGFLRMVLIP